MATYLDRILEAHRAAAAADRRDVDELVARATAQVSPRGFTRALSQAVESGHLAVISEVKRRSPSKGDLFAGLDPAVLATQYAAGGAACLSVLTDHEFFGGSPDDLRAARGAVTLPALRKDFTVSIADVADAALMGADCVLLIAAALSPSELGEMHQVATQIGLDVLVEVHDEAELEVALTAGARLVGVNQRDLVTFEVDHARAVRMGSIMPADVVRVAESGIRGPADAAALRDAGYHAVLVGESLVTSGDPTGAVAALVQATSG